MQTKRLSARTQKLNKFQPPAKEGNSDPQDESQVTFDPMTEIKSMSIWTLVSSIFRCPGIKKELVLIQKQTNHFDRPTKPYQFLSAMLKSSEFRPPTLHQNQFHPYTRHMLKNYFEKQMMFLRYSGWYWKIFQVKSASVRKHLFAKKCHPCRGSRPSFVV